MEKTNKLIIGTLLDGEDLWDLPHGSFSRVSSKILETACMMAKASRGLLLFLDEDQKIQLQSAFQYPHWQKDMIPLTARVKELLSSEKEMVLSSAGHCITALLRKRVRQFPGKDRRAFLLEEKELFFPELHRLVGLLYLHKKDSPFSKQDISLVENFLDFATHQLLQAKIYEISTLDATTHFFSRSQLERLLQGEIQLAEKHKYPLSVLLFSLKEKGEEKWLSQMDIREKIWSNLAELIRGEIRDADIPLRYSASEFYLLCPGAGEAGAEVVSKRLIEKIKAIPFFKDKAYLLPSLGISIYPSHGISAEELIHKSRQALNLASLTQTDYVVWHLHADKIMDVITGDLTRDYRNVLMLLDTIIALNSTLDYTQLLSIIVDMMIQITQSDRCILTTYDKEGIFSEILAQDKQGHHLQPTLYMEEMVELARQEGCLCTEKDMIQNPKSKKKWQTMGLGQARAIPLLVRGKTLGVIYVDSKTSQGAGSEQDQVFFYALTQQMALALDNSRLYKENLLGKKRVEELNKQLEEKFKKQEEELEEVKDTLHVNLQQLERKYTYSNIIGKSKALQNIFDVVDKISHTDAAVLITGESGTGKELIAKALHYNSPRRDKPFVSINCAALPDSLLESELFGHKKGAFTGALANQKGLFEMAHRGTLFLDEVGDMTLKMQRELLRVLQEGEVRPVGGREIIKVNARILSATNRNLTEMMEEGTFREDLYYRLNVIQIHLPALRDRREDILLLAEKFLEDFAREKGQPPKKLSPEAAKLLTLYDWPGNIRELQNFMERTAIICLGRTIGSEDVVLDFEKPAHAGTAVEEATGKILAETVDELKGYFSKEYIPQILREAMAQIQGPWKGEEMEKIFSQPFQKAKNLFVKLYLENLLEKNHYNITLAAQKAEMLRSYLHKLLKKYELPGKNS